MEHDSVTPYQSSDSKKEQVAQMFDNISHRYDFLNSLFSLGIHKGWRKKAVKMLRNGQPKNILDVATGTADFAIACFKLNPDKITGVDISEGMMGVGRKKIENAGLQKVISLEYGNAETLAYPDNTFDAIVVGFGVRNFQNLEVGLNNLKRVLKPGGQIVILEFAYPTLWLVKKLYTFYFSFITPAIGRMFSKDPRAYSYLTESVKAFPYNENFVAIMKKNGYTNCYYRSLSFGVAALYYAKK